jgi:SHS2 domain-containing protein
VCAEEALVEVVADPEAVKQKEEEQAAKEASRMERLLAKKFIV